MKLDSKTIEGIVESKKILIAFAYTKAGKKELFFTVSNGSYDICIDGKVKYIAEDSRKAADIYNEI